MAAPSVGETITLNFAWKGPTSWNGGCYHGGFDACVVDFLFKDAETDISVHIPNDISPSSVHKLPFTCRKYLSNGREFKHLVQATYPNSLKVTVEQICNLRIRVGLFEESPNQAPVIMDDFRQVTRERCPRRSDKEIKLQLPKKLEIDQIYCLLVTFNDLSPSARIVKEKRAQKESINHGLQKRMGKMGHALLNDDMPNLDLALKGGIGEFNTSSSAADICAHEVRECARASQELNNAINMPYTKLRESSSDLDKLTVAELQSRFEATCIKDKDFERQRIEASIIGDILQLNKITEAELENSQLLILLSEALERKGINPQMPQSDPVQAEALNVLGKES